MPSVLTAFVSRREQLVDGDSAVSLSKRADVRYRFVDFVLPPVNFWHDPRDGAAMASDDERLTSLYIIEELRQMGFRLGSLDFTHIGRFCLSI
jgi:hypothetical protein